MLAAVICSASPSSRDKGDPYDCFRSLDSMKLRSGPIVWALFVCRLVLGVFLTSSVLWIALEISGCHCKGISHKTLWSSTFYAIASDQLFEPCSLQDDPRSDLCCFLHELAVEISCCAQYVFSSYTKSFLHEVYVQISSCHQTKFPVVVKIGHSDWRNEL